jgi:competence protein ComEA
LAETLERYRWLIVALFVIPLIGGIIFLVDKRVGDDPPIVVSESAEPIGDIRVYITGAVVNPGVYPIGQDARWADAVAAAGGFTPDANPEAINLARRVHDEDHILVPRVGQALSAVQESLVDLNTASEADLMALPGIGEVRARNIITSRTAIGPFASTDELLVRDLIPQSTYDDIVALITVNQ